MTVPSTTAGALAGRLQQAAVGLCTARRTASDAQTTRRVFYERSHEPLHDLARAVQARQRATAARLLEAKETVEVDLDRPGGAARLAGDLDRLIRATGAALQALSIPPPVCAG